MTGLADQVSLWLLKPWFPFAWVLLLLLSAMVILGYWWAVRPQSRKATQVGALGLVLRLATTVGPPLLIVIGFALLLYPAAPPEVLTLRSQARVEGSTPLTAGFAATMPCFDAVLTQLHGDAASAPDCLARALPGPPDPAATAVAGDDTARQRAEWWQLARIGRLIDARPVVSHALDIYQDLATTAPPSSADGMAANLAKAVETAIAEISPLRVNVEAAAPDLPPRRDLPPDLVEAVETAVIRLMAMERNIVAVAVERRRHDDRVLSSNLWAQMQAQLTAPDTTAHGRPVIAAVFDDRPPGASALVEIIGSPWLHNASQGASRLVANLRFGQPPEDWTVSVADASGAAVTFQCVQGGATAAAVSRVALAECLPDARWLRGDGAVLLLDLSASGSAGPFRLTIDFPTESGTPGVSASTQAERAHAIQVAATGDASLTDTLNCLLSPPQAIQGSGSLRAFHAALTDGGRVAVTPGTSGAWLRAAHGGIWVYSESELWDRIETEVAVALVRPESATPIASGQPMFGAALFPAVFATAEAPSGVSALISTPLVANRGAILLPNQDPSEGLYAPRSAIIHRSDARPVAYSALPRLNDTGALSVFPGGVAPLIWQIDLPRDRDGSGGLVWFFDVDPEQQGLLLPNSCQPEWLAQNAYDFCTDPAARDTPEPRYDEARFFPFWLAMLRAARDSVLAAEQAPTLQTPVHPPAFVTSAMLVKARLASSAPAGVLLALGLFAYAISVVALRGPRFDRDR